MLLIDPSKMAPVEYPPQSDFVPQAGYMLPAQPEMYAAQAKPQPGGDPQCVISGVGVPPTSKGNFNDHLPLH